MRFPRPLLVLCLAAMTPLPGMAAPIWIPAEGTRAISPLMTRASQVGLAEAESLGDFLVPMVTATEDAHAPDCWAEFSASVPQEGPYWLWARVRFPAGPGEALRVVVRSENERDVRETKGDGMTFVGGSDAWQWQWVKAGKLDLTAGTWVLRVSPHRAAASTFGPLRWHQAELTQTPRLNLLCLSDTHGYIPSDADVPRILGLTKTPVAEPHVVPASLSPLSEGVLPPQGRKREPDWMRCPRWFTKDSWQDELQRRRPGDVAALVREVAANGGQTLRLSVFWGGEAYYQSRVAPHAPGLGEMDYLREAMDEAARTGVEVVAYMNPNALCLGHPLLEECAIRDAQGNPPQRPAYGATWRPKAVYSCIHHPRYRQFLRDLLAEMFARYRPAGLYVDGLTPHVCFCKHCPVPNVLRGRILQVRSGPAR
jgi:hypothetical protein